MKKTGSIGIRFVIFAMIGGGFLAWDGIGEIRVAGNASTEAVSTNLSDIESDSDWKENFLLIGEHVAINSELIYSYQIDDEVDGETPDEMNINYCYYPIISWDHEHFSQRDKLIELYGDFDSIPDDEYPSVDSFRVLVKTEKFKTVGDINFNWAVQESIQGLIINKLDSLDSDEEELIQSSFPNLDMKKVLILEEGRSPISPLKGYGFITLGSLLILGSIGALLFLILKGKSNSKETKEIIGEENYANTPAATIETPAAEEFETKHKGPEL